MDEILGTTITCCAGRRKNAAAGKRSWVFWGADHVPKVYYLYLVIDCRIIQNFARKQIDRWIGKEKVVNGVLNQCQRWRVCTSQKYAVLKATKVLV